MHIEKLWTDPSRKILLIHYTKAYILVSLHLGEREGIVCSHLYYCAWKTKVGVLMEVTSEAGSRQYSPWDSAVPEYSPKAAE